VLINHDESGHKRNWPDSGPESRPLSEGIKLPFILTIIIIIYLPSKPVEHRRQHLALVLSNRDLNIPEVQQEAQGVVAEDDVSSSFSLLSPSSYAVLDAISYAFIEASLRILDGRLLGCH
jgi:hypothetical protein